MKKIQAINNHVVAEDGLSIQDGINIAKDTIDTGKAKYQMERFIKYSNEVC